MLMTFKDIFGQVAAIDSIRRAYLADRLPHGLIFSGPAGVGKATTAQALGTLFLCINPKDDRPCGKCESCRLFDSDPKNHPDYHIITKELIRYHDKTGKSKGIELSIHVVRPELVDKAGMKPTMNRGKVFVIEQADLMNPQAQNSILKTLEEPAGRTVIVLITDQIGSLLPTVRSRCQAIPFVMLEEKVVREQLIARGVDDEAASRAATLSQGSLGIALQWLKDGVVETAGELIVRIEEIESGVGAGDLQDWFKKSADKYAEKQLERDELSSKDQATREGLSLYLRIASQHFSRRLYADSGVDAAALERYCQAIDAIARAEEYLDANVVVSLVFQQLSLTFDRLFVRSTVAATR